MARKRPYRPRPHKPCRHCGHTGDRPRQLCYSCYGKPEIRALYPPINVMGTYPISAEPTAEEVEAMVADGYRNLPSWWFDHEADWEYSKGGG